MCGKPASRPVRPSEHSGLAASDKNELREPGSPQDFRQRKPTRSGAPFALRRTEANYTAWRETSRLEILSPGSVRPSRSPARYVACADPPVLRDCAGAAEASPCGGGSVARAEFTVGDDEWPSADGSVRGVRCPGR